MFEDITERTGTINRSLSDIHAFIVFIYRRKKLYLPMIHASFNIVNILTHDKQVLVHARRVFTDYKHVSKQHEHVTCVRTKLVYVVTMSTH